MCLSDGWPSDLLRLNYVVSFSFISFLHMAVWTHLPLFKNNNNDLRPGQRQQQNM